MEQLTEVTETPGQDRILQLSIEHVLNVPVPQVLEELVVAPKSVSHVNNGITETGEESETPHDAVQYQGQCGPCPPFLRWP